MCKRRLTVSSARCFRLCPRKYKYRYVDGYVPVDTPEPLAVGQLLHTGLEGIWSGMPQTWPENADPYHVALVEALLDGYVARWGMPADAVAVEAEFVAPLVNPDTGRPSQTWELAGKIDALAGPIVEHKSTSEDISPGSNYWRRLRIDPQVSTYFVGARALGHDPAECMYDVIRKPAIRPLKATPLESRKYKKDGALYANQREHDETPEQYGQRVRDALAADPDKHYQRGTVVRLSDEERDAAHDMWQTAKAIRASELAGRWPRNPDACDRWGRYCLYFDACCASEPAEVLDDPLIFTKQDNVHTELSPRKEDSDNEQDAA